MEVIKIDEQKCVRCGTCASDCPMGIIAYQGKETVPVEVRSAGVLCIDCGHCVAVCPYGALSQRLMEAASCTPVNAAMALSPEQAEQYLRSRRSIRNYKDKAVPEADIAKLLRLATYAPSGHNMQPVSWIVVKERDEVQKFASLTIDWMRDMLEKQPGMAKAIHLDIVVAGWDAGIDTVNRRAPHLVIAHAPHANPTAPAAATIAFSYLELAAFSLGLGTCWAGFCGIAATAWPPFREALGLPEGHKSLGIMMLGYPKFRYHRLPERKDPVITWR